MNAEMTRTRVVHSKCTRTRVVHSKCTRTRVVHQFTRVRKHQPLFNTVSVMSRDNTSDIFVQSVANVARLKLRTYIEEECHGCRKRIEGSKRDRKTFKHKMYHTLMCNDEEVYWGDIVINCLPTVLKNITLDEIKEAMGDIFRWDTNEPCRPSVKCTFLYISYKDLLYAADMCLQMRVAQDVYYKSSYDDAKPNVYLLPSVEQFAEQYKEVLAIAPHNDSRKEVSRRLQIIMHMKKFGTVEEEECNSKLLTKFMYMMR